MQYKLLFFLYNLAGFPSGFISNGITVKLLCFDAFFAAEYRRKQLFSGNPSPSVRSPFVLSDPSAGAFHNI